AAFQRRAAHTHPFDPVEVQRIAGTALMRGDMALVVDDLEAHSSATSAGMSVCGSSAPSTAMCLVCSWLTSSCERPAPICVMDAQAQALRPRKRPRMTSGAVDMPTALAPRRRAIWISATVSKLGPEYQR